jgi:hypothetical protein
LISLSGEADNESALGSSMALLEEEITLARGKPHLRRSAPSNFFPSSPMLENQVESEGSPQLKRRGHCDDRRRVAMLVWLLHPW